MGGNAKPSTPSAGGAFPKALREMKFVKNYGVLLFFFLLIVVKGIFTPNLLSTGTAVNTLVQAFPIMLVALGMTMVISSGGIDISVGAVMAVSAAAAAEVYTRGVGLIPSLCCGILAGAL